MNLTLGLKYHDTAPAAPIAAAFVYGRHAGEWLDAVSPWQLPMEQLTALPVPQRDSAVTAGLLILLNGAIPPFPERIQYPYQQLDNLFMPVNTMLTPALTASERKALLIWDLQLFHPVLGFTGFNNEQIFPLSSLLAFQPPLPTDWEHARMGGLPAPHLERILLEAITADTVFLETQQQVGHQPLEDIIPTVVQQSRSKSLFDRLLTLLGIKKSLSSNERRRQALQRLSDLFDTDFNKALEYAIPLDNPYAPRGMHIDNSTSLQRKKTDFSLDRLGGGGPVSYWNVSEYEHSLRRKYLNAADKAVAAGDYRKAAYIFAHLLADYNQAAIVLGKGGFYREAAAVYLDHLKDEKAAAGMLEKGGFTEEAIEIYIRIEQHEKAGDLYMKLQQRIPAMQQYQLLIDKVLSHEKYQFAARIARDKMQDISQAERYLLTSWEKGIDPQRSLKLYFDLQTDCLPQAIQTVYRQHLPVDQQTDLLIVLKELTVQHPETAVRNTGLEIACEIAGKQLQNSDDSFLGYLPYFMPDDKLLPGDIHQYTQQKASIPTNISPLHVLQFAQDIQWLCGIRLPHQMLFAGIRENGIYLLDFDMEKKWYYHLWKIDILHMPPITMITRAMVANRVFLLGQIPPLPPRSLYERTNDPANAIHVERPAWFPPKLLGACITEKFVITLSSVEGIMTFRAYNLSGIPGQPEECRLNGQPFSMEMPSGKVQEIIPYQEWYYFFYKSDIFRCNKNGILEVFSMGAEILQMSGTEIPGALRIAIATLQGVMIIQFSRDQLCSKSEYLTMPVTPDIVLSWLPDNRLAIGNKLKATIYTVSHHSEKAPAEVIQYTTNATIRAVLPMPELYRIGILDDDGQFSIYELPA